VGGSHGPRARGAVSYQGKKERPRLGRLQTQRLRWRSAGGREPVTRRPSAPSRRASRAGTATRGRDARARGRARPGSAARCRAAASGACLAQPGRARLRNRPAFSTKFNRRLDRFLRRGISACRSEWRLTRPTTCSSSTATRPPPRPPEGAPALDDFHRSSVISASHQAFDALLVTDPLHRGRSISPPPHASNSAPRMYHGQRPM
jgi:hypothetical protein